MSALRLLYDVSFFIIVTTIGLNIVFGIIVDTFSELRDERVCHCFLYVHWNLFMVDMLETAESVLIIEVSSFQG